MVPEKDKRFSSPPPPKVHRQTVSLTQPPIQWVFLPEVEGRGCEADHSLPSIAKVQNEWRCNAPTHMLLQRAQRRFIKVVDRFVLRNVKGFEKKG
jgi:hypothetical protein